MSKSFDIVFALFPRCAQLDFIGAYEVFAHLPDANIRLASENGGDLTAALGLKLREVERLRDIERCDLLFVPGTADLSAATTPGMLEQLRRLAEDAGYVTSVCTGSLILGQAGLLQGRRSASHWAFLEQLPQYGAIPDPARIVRDGRFMSGGGVTACIDFALTVAAEHVDDTWAQMIQLYIEYAPSPPFDAGHPSTAPAEVLEAVRDRYGEKLAKIGGVIPEPNRFA
ncbi:DJ-1/PfpI family protein [Actinomadura madurae]|uniref:DJ-1/PfpI family protein n=1 Tax=Actinomadura madurae TaxID=1993 RepID=UPI0020267E68|nr:DJ-1/PfpI family protein [Actinomadura madurae]MCP9970346.1 DJ-1/PfpI family protein [Actinomadura madurae]MCP9982824.1 DJ-1/PfpI family protein [Actinomadura madurae]MCQ0005627.1 DJ-1/PfpI family protein [Actinomadura madurae]MCQ0019058.1 DJ-1/PfpI family protein [Actinomadura madurae]URN09758.1 DJ-1/PfpI family protein [Actinomadura madurae]